MSDPNENSNRAGSSAAGGETAGDVFPLRLTPFEFYYLLEDRPDYPSVFPIHLECRGAIDRAVFERAYRLAHARHPFLSAGIDRQGRWPNWVAGLPASIRWTEGAPASGEEPAARRSPAGVYVDVWRDGDRTVFVFVFHHVAVDGMGAFQFIADLMVAYAHGCCGASTSPPWRALDRQLLRDRDGHGLFKRRVKAIDLVRIARVSLPLLFRRAAVVSQRVQAAVNAGGEPSPDFLVHTLGVQETAELTHIAQSQSVRLNDLLVRDFFLMLCAWNEGTPEAKRPIRVLVPTNLRRKQDYRMPAANVFSYAFLTRRVRDCRHPAALLDSVHTEMAAIKRTRWGLYFEAGLRLFCIWPPLLRWSLKRKWAFATAIFSNLGGGFDHVPLPWRDGHRAAGGLMVENGYGAGPIRPETRLAFAAHKYAGRLSISVRWDKQVFGTREGRAILDAYLEQLRKTLGEGR